MPAKRPVTLDTLDVRNRRDFRKWLKKHHDSSSEIWLVFHKRHTGESECVNSNKLRSSIHPAKDRQQVVDDKSPPICEPRVARANRATRVEASADESER